MKGILKYFLLSFVAILFFTASDAQKTKSGNSLLWKISKKGIAEPSYLFGTIHVICADDYFWTSNMQQAFESTKRLCMEMNLSDPNLVSDAGLMMVDLSGGTLRDYFKNEADYNIVSRFVMDSLGQEMQIVERFKPVALYMMINMGIVSGPCKETVSYEMKLVEKATAKGLKMDGLETLAEQMEVMESIPTESIINQMIRIAKGDKSDNESINELMKAYKKQDLISLNKIMVRETNKEGADGKILIDNRNKKWIDPMGRMMNESATFFAVGAGHVYGLIELLRAEGYIVEAVK